MKVLIVGATGGTGKNLVECALKSGHEVTAFVRNPAKLTTKHERLRVVQGDVLQPETLAQAMDGQEAVLSALGPASNRQPGTLISDGTRTMLQAMKQNNVRLIIFESGIMVGDGQGLSMLNRLLMNFFRLAVRKLYEDKVVAEKLIKDSGITWIIVRPPGLKHGAALGTYRVGENLNANLLKQLPHADVADFMVKCLETKTYQNKAVDISA